jgi:hypothetical protein
MRGRDHDHHQESQAPATAGGIELPPGATFDPNPQAPAPAAEPKGKHAP